MTIDGKYREQPVTYNFIFIPNVGVWTPPGVYYQEGQSTNGEKLSKESSIGLMTKVLQSDKYSGRTSFGDLS